MKRPVRLGSDDPDELDGYVLLSCSARTAPEAGTEILYREFAQSLPRRRWLSCAYCFRMSCQLRSRPGGTLVRCTAQTLYVIQCRQSTLNSAEEHGTIQSDPDWETFILRLQQTLLRVLRAESLLDLG